MECGLKHRAQNGENYAQIRLALEWQEWYNTYCRGTVL
jgi:hypothetical protein